MINKEVSRGDRVIRQNKGNILIFLKHYLNFSCMFVSDAYNSSGVYGKVVTTVEF